MKVYDSLISKQELRENEQLNDSQTSSLHEVGLTNKETDVRLFEFFIQVYSI